MTVAAFLAVFLCGVLAGVTVATCLVGFLSGVLAGMTVAAYLVALETVLLQRLVE